MNKVEFSLNELSMYIHIKMFFCMLYVSSLKRFKEQRKDRPIKQSLKKMI